jgi:hypothetical protein
LGLIVWTRRRSPIICASIRAPARETPEEFDAQAVRNDCQTLLDAYAMMAHVLLALKTAPTTFAASAAAPPPKRSCAGSPKENGSFDFKDCETRRAQLQR